MDEQRQKDKLHKEKELAAAEKAEALQMWDYSITVGHNTLNQHLFHYCICIMLAFSLPKSLNLYTWLMGAEVLDTLATN